MKELKHLSIFIIIGVLICASCTIPPHYEITTELKKPVNFDGTFTVGEIGDSLSSDISEDSRPTYDDIDVLKDELYDKMEFGLNAVMVDSDDADYTIRGWVKSFSRGSSLPLFINNIKITPSAGTSVILELIDNQSNEILFSGTFFGSSDSKSNNSITIFGDIAEDFVIALRKQNREL